SEEHTSELQSRRDLVCRLLLEKKNKARVAADGGSPSLRKRSTAPCNACVASSYRRTSRSTASWGVPTRSNGPLTLSIDGTCTERSPRRAKSGRRPDLAP